MTNSTTRRGLIGYLVSHTHWDREWYLPFQGFRRRLVRLMDEMLAVMEGDPRYAYFHLDGQTIVLQDYLEIRPENRDRLTQLIREGRVLVGPWYVQPDESLPSAEAHIRNLLLGRRMAREFGGQPLASGYVVDVFGHISQLPQILRGFGIDNAILFRGMNDCECGAECWWEGADGTRALVLRLSNDVAYSDFWYRVRHPQMGRDFDVDEAVHAMRDFIAEFATRFSTRHVLLMDGVDHVEVEPKLGEFIERWNRDYSDLIELRHSTLPEYIAALRTDLGELPTFAGELRRPNRSGRFSNLFAGIHSSRGHLKRENDRCESLLSLLAEPWCSAAWLAGMEYPCAYLDLAWRYVLQNQPHDSICGCSVDQVHRDMEYRFDQARLIGRGLVDEAVHHLVGRLDTTGPENATYAIAVFAATPTVPGVAQVLSVSLPHPRPAHFRLVRPSGEDVAFQIISERPAVPSLEVGVRRIPAFPPKDVLTMAVDLHSPAMGIDTLFVVPRAAPQRTVGTLAAGPTALENEAVRVDVQPDGSLALVDKATRHVFRDLLLFEDGGDIGDGWTFVAPPQDAVVLSRGGPAAVSILGDGPLMATLRVRTVMTVPASIAPSRRERSDELVPLTITSDVSLLAGERGVRVLTVVENVARDHRLRVLFPTDLSASQWYADMQFDVVCRDIALLDTRDWVEADSELKPQQSFSCVTDGAAGLAVIAPTQKEAAVRDDPRRTIAVTLLRGFSSTVGTLGEDGAQCLGRHEFECAVIPFEGAAESAGLLAYARRMRARPITRTVAPSAGMDSPRGLVTVSPDVVMLSSVKRHESEGWLVVRVWNPLPDLTEVSLEVPCAIARAWLGNLAEERESELTSVTGAAVALAAPAKSAVTVIVEPVQK